MDLDTGLKPWCTGKQLPLGFNPYVLGSVLMMYDLEKASKSAAGISLYVSDDPKGSDEVLGPAGAGFPDQEARPVI